MLDVNRRELKYLVSPTDVMELKRSLAAVLSEDLHNGGNGYMVRSLYFDSLADCDFEDKVDGYDKRQKIRLRIYDIHSGQAKLELKEKVGNAQRKRSLLLDREEAERVIRGDYTFLMTRNEEVAHKLYTMMVMKCYRPKCIVEYDRMAYCAETNDIRITFDMNLRATELNYNIFDENLMLYPVSEAAAITMEVKYNGFLFTYIKNILNQSDKMQISNSKYCRARSISKRGRI